MIKKILLGIITVSTIINAQDMSLIDAKLITGYYINTDNVSEEEETPVILTFKLRGQKCKAFGIGKSSPSMKKINRGKILLTNGYCKKNKFTFEGYFYDKNRMFGAKGERTDNILTIRPQKGYFSIKNIKGNKKKTKTKGLLNKITI